LVASTLSMRRLVSRSWALATGALLYLLGCLGALEGGFERSDTIGHLVTFG
jgi:hypothetical protein